MSRRRQHQLHLRTCKPNPSTHPNQSSTLPRRTRHHRWSRPPSHPQIPWHRPSHQPPRCPPTAQTYDHPSPPPSRRHPQARQQHQQRRPQHPSNRHQGNPVQTSRPSCATVPRQPSRDPRRMSQPKRPSPPQQELQPELHQRKSLPDNALSDLLHRWPASSHASHGQRETAPTTRPSWPPTLPAAGSRPA